MCGRYASFLPAEFIARLFATVNPLPTFAPTWNMAPTMDAPVVRLVDGDATSRHLEMGPGPLFHEGPEEGPEADQCPLGDGREVGCSGRLSPSVGALCRRLPTTNGGTGRTARRPSQSPATMAIRWFSGASGKGGKPPDGERLRTFATIATDANRELSGIQDRMPVIIERDNWPIWLGEAEGDLDSLLRAAPEDVLRVWPWKGGRRLPQ